MQYLRGNWPKSNIGPKLHMLEDHVMEFLKRWRAGLGFFGEQGGESIHHEFKIMESRYANIKNPTDRLRYLMNQHLLAACPEAKILQPDIKRRKRKKTQQRRIKKNKVGPMLRTIRLCHTDVSEFIPLAHLYECTLYLCIFCLFCI